MIDIYNNIFWIIFFFFFFRKIYELDLKKIINNTLQFSDLLALKYSGRPRAVLFGLGIDFSVDSAEKKPPCLWRTQVQEKVHSSEKKPKTMTLK